MPGIVVRIGAGGASADQIADQIALNDGDILPSIGVATTSTSASLSAIASGLEQTSSRPLARKPSVSW
jgi:hypothetical protein